MDNESLIKKLLDNLPQQGTVTWLGVRPQRLSPLHSLTEVQAITDQKLEGDHYTGKKGSKRQVTLIQMEHLTVVKHILQLDKLLPEQLRRNIAVSGINLVSLKDRLFSVGEVILQGTGECAPCSRMEEVLGSGGYNAMRGHGGITARIIKGGNIKVGDNVSLLLQSNIDPVTAPGQ